MVYMIKGNNETQKTVETDFILSHNVYARAEVPPTDKVKLLKFYKSIMLLLNSLVRYVYG